METDVAMGRDFFPRPAIMDVLNKRLSAFKRDFRQNVGLIGQKYMGKSSILRNFLLTADISDLIPIYIEVGQEPFDHFAHKWMGAILYGILRSRTTDVPLAHAQIIKRARAACPNSVRSLLCIRKYLRKRDYASAFKTLLNLPAIISDDSKKKVIIVFDEFHRFEQFGIKKAFEIFGREIMIQKNTMFIVSSSSPELARHIFREQLSVLFGNFEIIEAQPLNFSECHNFIYHRLGRSDLKRSLERFLLRITDGNPYYLDIIVQRVRHIARDEWMWRLNENVFVDAIAEELYSQSGLLNLEFMNRVEGVNRGKTVSNGLNVLMAIAAGQKNLKGIARFTRRKAADVKKALLRLVEEGFVQQDISMFAISDSVFAFWLREIYMLRNQHFDLDSNSLADRFKSRLHALIRESEVEDTKELPERILKLFKQFGNDTIVIGQRRFKCPYFKEVRCKPSNGRVFPIYGETAHGLWMLQVVQERLKEEDVQRFVNDQEPLPKRPCQRIMIALRGSELNAKLIAKAHGVAVWNLRELNHLLNLYGQPKVII